MKPQKLFYILLAIWVLADLLQAIFTPVHADEAYYALYGEFLDWGYYDHPPMVALMTAFSSLFFKGTLSIRFMTVLLHGATVLLLGTSMEEKLTSNRAVITFFAIAASIPIFIIYGFITTPDAPLLFFTALFFYLYKRYLSSPSWPTALALGITFTAMLYSKYMAVLVVGFVLLSNFKLLKDNKIWGSIALATLLFLPHILWQVRNGFPSLQYHLIDRSEGFRIGNLLEYPLNQFLVFNPICLCIAGFLCWKKRKTEDLFERAILFTIAGFILFFWLMAVKGHAEPHWTAAASVPMTILLWQELRNEQWNKWLTRGIVPIVGALLVLRVLTPIFLNKLPINIFRNQHKYDIIHEYCGNTPVIFVGSFQDPSLYHYYTGDNTMQISSLYGRRTQFDLWQFDKGIQGKPACVIDANVYKRKRHEGFDLIEKDKVSFFLHKTESFQGTNRIQINIENYRIKNDSLYLNLTLFNPYETDFVFDNPEFPITLHVAYLPKHGSIYPITCPLPSGIIIPTGESIHLATVVKYIPDNPIVICLDNVVNRSVNSKPIKLKAND
jgi:hypothetical protein